MAVGPARLRGLALTLALAAALPTSACASTPARMWVADFAPLAHDEVLWLARGRAHGHRPGDEVSLWLARGAAEGGLAWRRELPGDAEPVIVHGQPLGALGDVVIVALRRESPWPESAWPEPDRVTGVHAFALADGTPRWQDLEGYGDGPTDLWPVGSIGDHRQRFELAGPRDPVPGGRARAYDATGVQWTVELQGILSTIAWPALLTDRYFVFQDQSESADALRWHVLNRNDGSEALVVAQEPSFGFQCASPRALFLQQRDGIDRIDLETLEHRRLAALPLPLPPTRGGWHATGCGVLDDGSLIVEASTPRDSLLVRLEPSTGEIAQVMDLEGFTPLMLPPQLPEVLAIRGFGEEFTMMAVLDLDAGELVGHPREVDSRRSWQTLVAGGRSWVLTRQRMGVIDPELGTLAGTRRLGRRWQTETVLAHGDAVWIPTDQQVRPDRLTVLVTRPGDLRRGSSGLARAMAPERIRKPYVPLLCRTRPTMCVHGDGMGISREPLPPVDPTMTSPDWNLAALHRSARRFADALPHARTVLLGWSIVEDDRPLRNHHAVVLVEHRKGQRPKYSLVTMYRHAVNTEWNFESSLHSSHRAVVRFDHRPTAAEVEEVLEHNGWQYSLMLDFAVLAGSMPEQAWRDALGEPPTRAIEITPASERPGMDLRP